MFMKNTPKVCAQRLPALLLIDNHPSGLIYDILYGWCAWGQGADAKDETKPAPKWGQAKKPALAGEESEAAEPKPPTARSADSETKASKMSVVTASAGGGNSGKSAVSSPWATAAVKGKGVAKFLLKAKQAQANLEFKQQAAAAAVTPGALSDSNSGESSVPAWKRDLAKKTRSKDSVSGGRGAVDNGGGASAPYPASPEQPPEPLDASYADYDADEGISILGNMKRCRGTTRLFFLLI